MNTPSTMININLSAARQLVIKAGLELVSSGLIARTWGNVSCRISSDLFVITPSGRSYETLSETDIVPVRISDLSYEGSVIPSSEKRIHAAAYRLNPQARFIIHTHQEKASIVSALSISSIPVPSDWREALGAAILCAAYGLPGTKTLCRNTADALRRSAGKAVIMKHHGALCVGSSYEETFRTASLLETVCSSWLDRLQEHTSGTGAAEPTGDLTSIHYELLKGRRATGGFILTTEDSVDRFVPFDGRLPRLERECALCSTIFTDHGQLNHIEISVDKAVLESISHSTLEPWLDDFAQIIGTRLTVVPPEPSLVSRSLRQVSAALIRNLGGLCVGVTESDAAAVRQLLEKNCRASRAAALYATAPAVSRSMSRERKNGPQPIGQLDASLMRRSYLNNYSKLNHQNV